MNDFTPEEIEQFKRRLAAEQQAAQAQALTHRGVAPTPPSSAPQARMYDPSTGTIGGEVNPLVRALMGMGAGTEKTLASAGEMLGMVSPERYQQVEQETFPFMTGVPGAVGGMAGELATSTLLAGPAGRVMGVAGPMARAIGEGALIGAITAGPEDRKTGAAYGAAGGAAVPALSSVYKGVTRGMEIAPAARKLQRRGVELTPGQMKPEGSWAMIEESMMRIPLVGPRVAAARERGWQQTKNLISKESAPPGYMPPDRADVRDAYKDLKNAYDTAYDQFKGYPLQPAMMRVQGGNVPLTQFMAVPRQAAADPKSRRYVQTFIDNELGRIKGRQLDSKDLLEIRSNIRAKIRDLSGNQNFPDAEGLLKTAEQRATEVLESQLPPNVMKSLREVDAKYGNFKVLESAIDRSKDRPDAFTPAQFSMAVKESTPSKGQYAAGGGRMRDIARESADVFSPRTPMTGAQQPSQLAGYVVGAPLSLLYGKNRGAQLARALMSGQTRFQQMVREQERALRRKLTADEREDLARLVGASAAFGAESDRPYFATTAED